MLVTFNNQVACKPFKDTSVKAKSFGSLQLADTGAGGNLIELEVVVDSDVWPKAATWSERIKAGSRIYVKADCVQHAWAKSVCFCDRVVGLEKDGKGDLKSEKQPFIFVPAEHIQFYIDFNE